MQIERVAEGCFFIRSARASEDWWVPQLPFCLRPDRREGQFSPWHLRIFSQSPLKSKKGNQWWPYGQTGWVIFLPVLVSRCGNFSLQFCPDQMIWLNCSLNCCPPQPNQGFGPSVHSVDHLCHVISVRQWQDLHSAGKRLLTGAERLAASHRAGAWVS